MKLIPLIGKHSHLSTQVDDIDFSFLSQWDWIGNSPYKGSPPYAYRSARGGVKPILMHVLLLSPPKGMEVGHEDGDRLNNQRSNIRLATRAQNCANTGKKSVGTSSFIGVCFKPSSNFKKPWYVSLGRKFVGNFDDEIEAAIAYDKAAKAAYGPFARTNF